MKIEIKTAEDFTVLAAELYKRQSNGQAFSIEIKDCKQRTVTQNAAIHKYCTLMADALNSAGFDYRHFVQNVMKEGYKVPWSMELFKNSVWKVVQDAMIGKASTTELTTEEVSRVYEVVNRKMAEHGVSMEFPNRFGG